MMPHDASRRATSPRGTAAEVTSVRERCAALEQARALADAARERAGTDLIALRHGDEPKIVRLLDVLEKAETRREQEDDRSSCRGDADVGDGRSPGFPAPPCPTHPETDIR